MISYVLHVKVVQASVLSIGVTALSQRTYSSFPQAIRADLWRGMGIHNLETQYSYAREGHALLWYLYLFSCIENWLITINNSIHGNNTTWCISWGPALPYIDVNWHIYSSWWIWIGWSRENGIWEYPMIVVLFAGTSNKSVDMKINNDDNYVHFAVLWLGNYTGAAQRPVHEQLAMAFLMAFRTTWQHQALWMAQWKGHVWLVWKLLWRSHSSGLPAHPSRWGLEDPERQDEQTQQGWHVQCEMVPWVPWQSSEVWYCQCLRLWPCFAALLVLCGWCCILCLRILIGRLIATALGKRDDPQELCKLTMMGNHNDDDVVNEVLHCNLPNLFLDQGDGWLSKRFNIAWM